MRWPINILIIYSIDLIEMISWSVFFQLLYCNTEKTMPEVHRPRSLQYREHVIVKWPKNWHLFVLWCLNNKVIHHSITNAVSPLVIMGWVVEYKTYELTGVISYLLQVFQYGVMMCDYLLNIKSESHLFIDRFTNQGQTRSN